MSLYVLPVGLSLLLVDVFCCVCCVVFVVVQPQSLASLPLALAKRLLQAPAAVAAVAAVAVDSTARIFGLACGQKCEQKPTEGGRLVGPPRGKRRHKYEVLLSIALLSFALFSLALLCIAKAQHK